MKKVLIFKIDKIAYNSTGVFSDLLGAELEKLGIYIDFFDAQGKSKDDLEQLLHDKYDAVIDFNSRVPRLLKDEEGYFLDYMKAPFFNYILDHPIYHHASLKAELKDYHVICMDDTHEQYIRMYYPHIKNVLTQPLGAIRTQNIVPKTFLERKYQLVFLGTYLNASEYYALIHELPPVVCSRALAVIDILLSNTHLTFEEAVRIQRGEDYDSALFPAEAQMMFLADIYVRACFREKVLIKIAKTGCQMDVFGENYTESEMSQFSNVCVHPSVPYAESLRIMSESRFVLNIMPWFKAGIHDRVLNAMINGAVSISDTSSRMDQYFYAGKDYLNYQLDDLDSMDHVMKTCQNLRLCETIADAGRKKAEHMTFAEIAKKINDIINKND